MRETRTSGLAGGAVEPNRPPLPRSLRGASRNFSVNGALVAGEPQPIDRTGHEMLHQVIEKDRQHRPRVIGKGNRS